MSGEIGIVGLGVMGGATGRHLLAAGFEVHGFDVDLVRREEFAAMGGTVGDSAADVAARVDTVVTWLPSPEALAGTVEQVVNTARSGAVLIEMGTLALSAKQAARRRLAAAGVEMLDCPVSGTGRQAEDATLVVYGSGPKDVFDSRISVFEPMGTWRYLGEFGNGTVMKFVANLLVTVHTLAAAEAHNLAAAAGMDPELVQHVIAEGVGSSRMWEIRGSMMATGTYEPPAGRLDIIKKDAGLIAEYAGEKGVATPALDLALDLYRAASAEGLGALDAAAIRLHLQHRGGAT
jgi:3-hydroxyisobutyrate dehydrogenase-like beta-hydroxyacid dehydrogenase